MKIRIIVGSEFQNRCEFVKDIFARAESDVHTCALAVVAGAGITKPAK